MKKYIINAKLTEILDKQKNYSKDQLLMYVLAAKFYLNAHLVPTEVKLLFKDLGIYKINPQAKTVSGIIEWVIPVFQDETTEFDWVDDWRKSFTQINNERAGSLPTCKDRMRKLFGLHPDLLTKEIAFKARDNYFAGLTDWKYLKTSHKFIYENNPSNSLLVTYAKLISKARNNSRNKML